ncbi:hypothetical protein GGI35DRAFT_59240 [Trichoderma velutinum]
MTSLFYAIYYHQTPTQVILSHLLSHVADGPLPFLLAFFGSNFEEEKNKKDAQDLLMRRTFISKSSAGIIRRNKYNLARTSYSRGRLNDTLFPTDFPFLFFAPTFSLSSLLLLLFWEYTIFELS